ncbi:hypothetical protein SEA_SERENDIPITOUS_78 [Mycobacterium phage Serendipitous]|uniref:Uncharacterized protein n=1 Tax=Mycobacterium phage Serendipitous TaxID=2301619 RepID=A0A385UK06_9CAUD|nr:hypothetical protein I5G64_gp78 [Mycobacterium phage Serendipitous]AYB70619.1 hypothetical protein SEA_SERENDIPITOUS_78 [Mycobacterium phage Serendipitous]
MGFEPTGTMTGEEDWPTGEIIDLTRPRETSFEVQLTYVHPAIWWLAFNTIRPDMLHDACWDGEAIR